MTRWIDAMLPAERDELIDAGRIGPSRFDGPDEGEEPDARFWSKVDKSITGCWLWTGAGAKDGQYGRFWHNGKIVGAHRYAWERLNGPIPEGMDICHHCDTPPCVRPEHLFLGTPTDNAMDMVAKGRHYLHVDPSRAARGDRHGAHVHPDRVARGERNGSAILTEDQVVQIKLRYFSGGVTQAVLGAEYGVSEAAVGKIVNGQNWAHVHVSLPEDAAEAEWRAYRDAGLAESELRYLGGDK